MTIGGEEYAGGLVDELTDEEKKMFGQQEDDIEIASPDVSSDDTPTDGEAPAEAVADQPDACVEGEPPADAAAQDQPADPAVDAPEAKEEQPKLDEDLEDGDEVEVENKGRFIRHGAFHRQREKAKQFKGEADELRVANQQLRDTLARADERMNMITQAMQQQPQQPQQQMPEGQAAPQPVDLSNIQAEMEKDPFAVIQSLANEVHHLRQGQQTVAEHVASTEDYSNVTQTFQNDVRRFAGQQPDFMDAYTHLLNSRNRELELMGYTDQGERNQLLKDEEYAFVTNAMSRNLSPAELAYQLATDRGYRKAEPEPEPAPAPAPAPTPTQQVQKVSEATQRNKSLSSASGSGAQQLSAEALANMSEDEFFRVFEKMTKDQQRQYFGG